MEKVNTVVAPMKATTLVVEQITKVSEFVARVKVIYSWFKVISTSNNNARKRYQGKPYTEPAIDAVGVHTIDDKIFNVYNVEGHFLFYRYDKDDVEDPHVILMDIDEATALYKPKPTSTILKQTSGEKLSFSLSNATNDATGATPL